jgi:HSP20 family protein
MRRLQQEVERLFGDMAPVWRWPLTGDYPPINVVRTDNGLTLEAMCPGVDRETLEITVVGDAVTLHCERTAPPDVPSERYHRRERPVGAFTRTVTIGEHFDPDRAHATYADGLLRVDLSRAAEATPKRIQIQS